MIPVQINTDDILFDGNSDEITAKMNPDQILRAQLEIVFEGKELKDVAVWWKN